MPHMTLSQLAASCPVQHKTLQHASQRLPIAAAYRIKRADYYDERACRLLVLSALLQDTGFPLPLVRRMIVRLKPEERLTHGTLVLEASGAVAVTVDLSVLFKDFHPRQES